ncbi:hypothetical protein F2P56_015302 [Juglans regia]|uniref:Retrotransposon gag domain-containing protein n=1 Tax=Juglans regia TaxID=51240 RepID=A0A833XFG4_JUGRE|nr:hypothetical protein F2P56_015302 [Juglans regia]
MVGYEEAVVGTRIGDVATLTWERFKREFDSCFFPEMAKQQKVLEFENLTQGNMTIEQCAARFMEIGRFAPHLIGIEHMQAQKFQDGLQPRIQNQVTCLQIENFQELVNATSIVEAKQRSLISKVHMNRKKGMPCSPGKDTRKRNIPYVMDKGKGKVVRSAVPVTPHLVKNVDEGIMVNADPP